jgi:hypothetical protein
VRVEMPPYWAPQPVDGVPHSAVQPLKIPKPPPGIWVSCVSRVMGDWKGGRTASTAGAPGGPAERHWGSRCGTWEMLEVGEGKREGTDREIELV